MSIVTDHVSVAAIDSTGFVTDSVSYYYSKRSEKLRKDYLMITISVNTDNRSIFAIKTTNYRRHDSQAAIQVLRASHRTKSDEVYVMDNAYDSEAIHDFILNNLKSDAIIPIRNWNASYDSEIYRLKMAIDSDSDLYHENIMLRPFSL